jgi:hypothetical protein
MCQIDEEDDLECSECEIGLIREETGTLDSGSCIVRPVTAKQSILNTKVNDVLESFQMAVLRIPKQGYREALLCAFQKPAASTKSTVNLIL